LALTFIAFIAAFGIAAPFMNDGLALLVAVIVLGLLVWMWRRSWRRYRAPLVRLVPAPDYQQFVTREEPVERRGRLKLDLRILKRAEPGD
jgi:membrane protein implicated in regulation of membrane protease activity